MISTVHLPPNKYYNLPLAFPLLAGKSQSVHVTTFLTTLHSPDGMTATFYSICNKNPSPCHTLQGPICHGPLSLPSYQLPLLAFMFFKQDCGSSSSLCLEYFSSDPQGAVTLCNSHFNSNITYLEKPFQMLFSLLHQSHYHVTFSHENCGPISHALSPAIRI